MEQAKFDDQVSISAALDFIGIGEMLLQKESNPYIKQAILLIKQLTIELEQARKDRNHYESNFRFELSWKEGYYKELNELRKKLNNELATT